MYYGSIHNASWLATGMMSVNGQRIEHGKRGSRAVAEGEPVSMSDYPFLDPQFWSSDSLSVRAAPADTIDLDKVASHIDKAIKNVLPIRWSISCISSVCLNSRAQLTPRSQVFFALVATHRQPSPTPLSISGTIAERTRLVRGHSP